MTGKARIRFGVQSMLAFTAFACLFLAIASSRLTTHRHQAEVQDRISERFWITTEATKRDALDRLLRLCGANLAKCTESANVRPGVTQITTEDVQLLKDLQGITEISLAGAQADDDAFKELSCIPTLKTIYLTNTSVSKEAIESVVKRRPDLKVVGGGVDSDAVKAASPINSGGKAGAKRRSY